MVCVRYIVWKSKLLNMGEKLFQATFRKQTATNEFQQKSYLENNITSY